MSTAATQAAAARTGTALTSVYRLRLAVPGIRRLASRAVARGAQTTR